MLPTTRRIQLALLLIGVAALAIAAWDILGGGFYAIVAGVRVSSREAYKPFRLGLLAVIASLWLHDRQIDADRASWHRLPAYAPAIAAAAAVVAVAVAIRYGIFAAGGADAYGYVSQAAAWARAQIVTPNPLAALESTVGSAVAPLGYRLAPTAGAIVPVYAPGLPLMMAMALKLGGTDAVYYVVPILGGVAVWCTYLLGARLDRRLTGMIAAIMLAFSPIFVFQSLEPMSDVPATAWWMLAWVLASASGAWPLLASGLAVSAAVLTRPNLVPLALVILIVVAAAAPRFRRLALFAAGSIPGCLIIAALNARWYGSPLASGYGPAGYLYAWSHWQPNLQRYSRWLVDLQSPAILLALVAPFSTRFRHRFAMIGFAVAVLGCYLWYLVYDTWPFLRFLLPAIPLLLLLSSAVVVRLVERLPLPFRTASVFLLCTLLPLWFVVKATSLNVFKIQRAEHRYVAVGESVGRLLPPNTIVFSVIQSGSVRLYGGLPTIRWDMIDPERLDRTIAMLQSSGYVPYLLLEDWEVPLFEQRFGGTSSYGRLDWPPAVEYRDVSLVRVYDPADRDRHRSGQPISTTRLPAN
jgi:hypothetical protein